MTSADGCDQVREMPARVFSANEPIRSTVYRKFARLLQTCNQAEIGFRLGWSRRRIFKAMNVIRQHFAGVEWAEIDFFRDEVQTNCIASTGEDDFSIHDHDINTEKPL